MATCTNCISTEGHYFYRREGDETCYSPGGCSVDSTNKQLYGCFAAAGDLVPSCRSSCVNGTGQDSSRTLFMPSDYLGAERGVELYENFGLDQTYRNDNGLYGKNEVSSFYGTDYKGPDLSIANTIQDHGRMVSIFGNTEFSVFNTGYSHVNDSSFWTGGGKIVTNSNVVYYYLGDENDSLFEHRRALDMKYDGLCDMAYVNTLIANKKTFIQSRPFISGWVMRIKYACEDPSKDDYYKYIGNSGIVAKSYNGNSATFRDKDPSNATIVFRYNNINYYLSVWDASTKTLWIDATFWHIIANSKDGEYLPGNYKPSASPADWDSFPGGKGGTSPCTFTPVTHGYDGENSYHQASDINVKNSNGRTEAGFSTTPRNTSSSGFKSMYIPPHMEVRGYEQSFTNTIPIGVNLISSSEKIARYNINIYGEHIHAFSDDWVKEGVRGIPCINSYVKVATMLVNGETKDFADRDIREVNIKLPLKNSMSDTKNGVWLNFGTGLPNSIARKKDIWTNEPAIYDLKNNSKTGIYTGALIGIKCAVKTDTEFYGNYVAIFKDFCPEIVLIPGFKSAGNFKELNTKSDTMQFIRNPQNFWAPLSDEDKKLTPAQIENNIKAGKAVQGNHMFSTGMPVVRLDTKSKPDAIIPSISTTATAATTVATTSMMVAPRMLKPLVNAITSPIMSLIVGETPSPSRIISFDVSNGIWSLEWTYILFACAMKGYIADYNPNKKIYTYGDNNAIIDNCHECMLFVDPYISSNSTNNVSNATKFMQAYCNLRNKTLAYIDYKREDNTCTCETDTQFCTKTMDARCSPTSNYTNYFLGDDVAKDKCSDQAITNYCEITNTQIEIATKYGVNTDALNNINIEGGCGQQENKQNGKDGEDDPPVEAAVGDGIPVIVWILLVILLVVIFGAISVGGYLYTQRNNK